MKTVVDVAFFFLDTSAVVKRYINEAGTPWIQMLHEPPSGHNLWLARITGVELVAALFRRVRMNSIAVAQAQGIRQRWVQDFTTSYRIIDINAALISRAMVLAEQFGLRGYDATQLAAASELDAERRAFLFPHVTFVSADQNLNAAAEQVGLGIEDPNQH